MTEKTNAANTRRPVQHLGTDDLRPQCGSNDTAAEVVYNVPNVTCGDCLRAARRMARSYVMDSSNPVSVAAHSPEAEAAYHAQADRNAAVLWLRHAPRTSTARGRQALVHRMMMASVFLQAGLLGVVNCTRCGDRGCDWCSPLTRLVRA